MKHTGESTLAELRNLLLQIRQTPLLKEKKPGIFYLDAKAFLHFHEDPNGIFADLKINSEWKRFKVTTETEQKTFIEKLREVLA